MMVSPILRQYYTTKIFALSALLRALCGAKKIARRTRDGAQKAQMKGCIQKKKGTSSVPISLWVDGFNSFIS